MTVTRLEPTCNLDTVRDGRGGIFTFFPDEPIVEFNLNIVKAGKVRGHHYHPEFDEYYLVSDGEGVIIWNDESDREQFLYLSRGHCIRTTRGTAHVFHAITDCTLVVMLTKRWDDCDVPVVHAAIDS